jgi:permease for cytosine/purines
VSAFSGRRPRAVGDLSVETHGIAPIPEDQRYGTPRRLFTVWFAPQVNMTGPFTGTLAIVLGLGFWLGLLAMVIGTLLGALLVGYLSTLGPRTGAGQLPSSRMAFGGGVVIPALLQWLSSIAWDAMAGLFGAEALTVLLGVPFWITVLVVLGAQGVVGYFGYELIHRLQAVLTVVLFATFVMFAIKLVGGHDVITPVAVGGPDLAGAVVLEVTIAFSAGVSWTSYAADFSRYLPADANRVHVFGYMFAGIVSAYVFVQGIGIAAGNVLAEQTAEGVRSVMGGGLLGGLALVAIVLASIGSGVMTVYSGSLALQTIGVRVRRTVSARHRHGARVRAHSVAARRRHRDALSGRAAARELLDSGVRRGGRYRLAATHQGAGERQPRRGAHRPQRRGGRGARVRVGLRRGDPVHEHIAHRGAGRQGVARRRHRIFREPAGGRAVLRHPPDAVYAPQRLTRGPLRTTDH